MNRLYLFTATIFLAVNAIAKDEPEITFATSEVAEGIYMISGVGGFTGGNIALTVGDDGVVMIDDSMPPMLEKLQASVKAATDKHIDYLINTHIHGDHIGNNQAFGEQGTHIVAHDNLRAMLLEKGIYNGEEDVPAPAASLPVISYSESMSLHLNGEEIDLVHLPAAHTSGDTVVIFKQANVIHAGDIFFNGAYPYIDLGNGGSVAGYISAHKAVLELADENTRIIPGHGPLASKADLQKTAQVLVETSNIVQKLLDEGKTAEEITELDPLASYHEKWGNGFIDGARMTQQLINALHQ